MMKITSLLVTSFLGTGIHVLACKSKETTPEPPPPPACTEGDAISDEDYVINPNITKYNAVYEVPSTVYVETMVAIDEYLYKKIGKNYKNGKWAKDVNNQHSDEEVYLYARKFLSAVSIKFQGQFKDPKIQFFLREAFKTKTLNPKISNPVGL